MTIKTAKTERITILGTPSFKAFLSKEAKKEGVSVSELVRSRCERRTINEDEETLAELIKQVTIATKIAQKSLLKGISDAQTVLSELQKS